MASFQLLFWFHRVFSASEVYYLDDYLKTGALSNGAHRFGPQTVEQHWPSQLDRKVQDWMHYIPNTQQVYWKTLVHGTAYHQVDVKMYTKCSKVIIYQRFHVYVRIASCGYIAVRKICDIYWEEHNMCCLVVQCSTKANHDDEVLPQFLEPLRFFVRFDGISVPVTTPAPMIPGREKTSWNIGKTRFKFALPLAVWCGMQFVPKNLGEFTNPNWPDNSPWIRLYCCGQWGWDSLLKRSQTVDVAFGGCLWSLATGDRILLKLEKISLIRQIYLEPYGSMMFNGTTHIFPSSQSIRLRLPEISPRCHSHGFEIRLLWIRFLPWRSRLVSDREIEATILPQLHSCRIKVKGLQPCTIFPACPEGPTVWKLQR